MLPPHYQPHTDWQIQPDQSGPFPEDTKGDWRTYHQAVLTFLTYETGLKDLDYPAGRWHDVHCRAPIGAANPIYSPHRRPRRATAGARAESPALARR